MPVAKKAIADVHPDLVKLMSKGLLMKGSDKRLVVDVISTGIPQVDEIIYGGIPLNRFTEIFGDWSAGKTLLAQLIAASFQRQGKTVALVDAELSYEREWWETTGVNTEDLLVSQPPGGEAGVDVIEALIGHVGLIIIDSLMGLVPLAVREKEADESVMGRHPQLIQRLYQKCLTPIIGSGTAIIAINQVRANFAPGSFDTLPGGKSQEFFSNTMLRLRRVGWLEESGQRVGFKMQVYTQKSKRGRPQREVILPFRFNGTFDQVSMVVTDAIDKGYITQGGAWYRIPAAFIPDEIPDGVEVKDVGTDGLFKQVMGRVALNALFEDLGARTKLEDATYAEKLRVVVPQEMAS